MSLRRGEAFASIGFLTVFNSTLHSQPVQHLFDGSNRRFVALDNQTCFQVAAVGQAEQKGSEHPQSVGKLEAFGGRSIRAWQARFQWPVLLVD